MVWGAAGLKLAHIGIAAFKMVQESKTENKQKDKLGLAVDFAQQMLGNCADAEAAGARALIVANPKVREAFEQFASAFVNLQNVIAKESGQ